METASKYRVYGNILLSLVGLVVNTGINLILIPYITNYLGAEAYGFVSTCSYIVSLADIVAIALNSLAARYIALAYHEGDKPKANTYYTSVFVANIVLASIILIPCLVCIPHLEKYLVIPEYLIHDVKVLMSLTVVNYIIMLLSNVFNVTTLITNHLELNALYKNITYIIRAASLLLLFRLFKPHVWYVQITYILESVFLWEMNIYLTKKLLPDLSIRRAKPKIKYVKEIVTNGIWSSVSNLGSNLNNGLDLVVSNLMLSPLATGQLSIVRMLANLFNTVIVLVTNAFRPIQLKVYATKDRGAVYKEINYAVKITGCICNIVVAGLVVLGKDFLMLWVPTQDTELLYNVMIVILIGDICGSIAYPLNYVFTLTGHLKWPSLLSILSGLVNVGSMMLLLQWTSLGLYAVVGTSAVLNILVQCVCVPYLACKELNVSRKDFYHIGIRIFVSCILVTLIYKEIVNALAITADSWLKLVLMACVVPFVSVAVDCLLVLNRQERRQLTTLINKKLRIRK